MLAARARCVISLVTLRFLSAQEASQWTNQSFIDSVSIKLKDNAANEILPYFLVLPGQIETLSNHGCWCAKILNPEQEQLGGGNTVDELDAICKRWWLASSCIQSLEGACYRYDLNEYTNVLIESGATNSSECEIPQNHRDIK